MKRHSLALAAMLACAALAGCAHVPPAPVPASLDPDRLDAGAAIAAAAAAVPDAAPADRDWWDSFADPQLRRLMARVDDAPALRQAHARVDAAAADALAAQAPLGVTLNAAGTVSAQAFPDHYRVPPPYAGHGGSEGVLTAQIRYRLDFWGKWRAAAEQAGQLRATAQLEADDVRLGLRMALLAGYLRLDVAWRDLDLCIQDVDARGAALRLLQARRERGLAADLDVAAAREAVALAEAERARAEGVLARRRHALAALLGQGPGFAEKLARPAPGPVADPMPWSALPASLLGRRPDVAARRNAVTAAQSGMAAARADFYPDVDLAAFVGLQSLGVAHLLRAGSVAAGVGPALTLPLFDNGRRDAAYQSSHAGYDAAVSAYDATVAAALQQVADALASRTESEGRRRALADVVAQRERTLSLLQLRRERGLADERELVFALLDAARARHGLLAADADLADARVALVHALGGAWAPASPTKP